MVWVETCPCLQSVSGLAARPRTRKTGHGRHLASRLAYLTTDSPSKRRGCDARESEKHRHHEHDKKPCWTRIHDKPSDHSQDEEYNRCGHTALPHCLRLLQLLLVDNCGCYWRSAMRTPPLSLRDPHSESQLRAAVRTGVGEHQAPRWSCRRVGVCILLPAPASLLAASSHASIHSARNRRLLRPPTLTLRRRPAATSR